MFQRFDHRLGHYALLIGASACLFLLNLGGPYLWDIDEGRNAAASIEMRESGDWVVPRFNGQLRSHKPALLYWLQVAAYGAFGINEFAARLPSALAAMLTVLSVYELGRRMFNASTGLIGGLILASSTLFCAAAHFANPDALLVCFTTVTLLFLWVGMEREKKRWFAAAGMAAGLAMLAKGPVGLVLPAAVAASFLVWSRRWALLLGRLPWLALLTCMMVASPWYILVALDTKSEFLADFLVNHNLGRALKPMEDHAGPPWYYLIVILIGLAPWSAFLGSSLFYAGRDARLGPDRTDSYRMLTCWVAIYVLAFSIAATKLPNYILPTFPPLALVLGRFLDGWRRGEFEPARWAQTLSLSILAMLGLATSAGLLLASGAIEVSWARIRPMPGLEQWAWIGIIPLAGAGVGGWLLFRQRRTAFVQVMILTSIGFLTAIAAGGSLGLNPYRAPRSLVAQAGALQREQEIQIGCYQLEFLPSLNFYVQRQVKHHQSDAAALSFLRQDLPVFLFLPRRQWDQLAPRLTVPCRVVGASAEMYHGEEVVVVSNH